MRISLENPSKDKINIFGVPESLVALHHCTWSPSPQSSWSRCRCSYCGCGHCPGHWQLNSPTHAQCAHTHTHPHNYTLMKYMHWEFGAPAPSGIPRKSTPNPQPLAFCGVEGALTCGRRLSKTANDMFLQSAPPPPTEKSPKQPTKQPPHQKPPTQS